MPAARYWRAVGLQAVGGGALELSALHLYVGGARVDAAAALTSTIAPSGGTLALLQDDNLVTTARWLDVSAPGFALVWDFGSGNAQDVSAVRLGSGALYAEWLETVTLQYSSDGMAWATLGTVLAFSWPGVNTLQAMPADGDGNFSAVSLLLHIDGADGSTVFTDSSAAPKTLARYGNPRISTAQSKWGGASAYFDGNGSKLEVPSNPELAFGTGDFTVECWVFSLPATGGGVDFDKLIFGGFQGDPDFACFLKSFNLAPALWNGSIAYESQIVVPPNTWTHVAWCRALGVLRIFVNGKNGLEASMPTQFNQSSNYIGGEADTRFLNGYIDDLRITKGVARYTANFTPPTVPFPDTGIGATTTQTLPRASMPERAQIAASAPVPAFSTRRAPALATARDVEVGGPGTIYGTTKTKGTPNRPARARVVLLHQRSKLPVRETWSDPVTGNFAFPGIDTRQAWLVLAEDAAGGFRPVAASQLVAEVQA